MADAPRGTASAPPSYEENRTDNFTNEKIMTSAPTTPDSLPRIIIVGGGFGGLAAARELKKARARVGLIARLIIETDQPGTAEPDPSSSRERASRMTGEQT